MSNLLDKCNWEYIIQKDLNLFLGNCLKVYHMQNLAVQSFHLSTQPS